MSRYLLPTTILIASMAFVTTACEQWDSFVDEYSDVDEDATDADDVGDGGDVSDASDTSDVGGFDTATDTRDTSTDTSGLSAELERLFTLMENDVDDACRRDLECIDDMWSGGPECLDFWDRYLDDLRETILERTNPEGCLEMSLQFHDCSMAMSSCGAYRAAEMAGEGCETEDRLQGQYCRYAE